MGVFKAENEGVCLGLAGVLLMSRAGWGEGILMRAGGDRPGVVGVFKPARFFAIHGSVWRRAVRRCPGTVARRWAFPPSRQSPTPPDLPHSPPEPLQCSKAAKTNDQCPRETLGNRQGSCWTSNAPKIKKESIYLPGPDFIDRVFTQTDRNVADASELPDDPETPAALAGTGYVSILPVDQGIEHFGGRVVSLPNPLYFDPEGDCEAGLRGADATRWRARSACWAPWPRKVGSQDPVSW